MADGLADDNTAAQIRSNLAHRTFQNSASLFLAAFLVRSCFPLAEAMEGADPHWNEATCQSCHADASPTTANHDLAIEDVDNHCENCHSARGNALPCRHLSNIHVGGLPLPDAFRDTLVDDRLVCTSCHDLTVQCRSPHRAYRQLNPGFVRNRNSRNRAEYCVECHGSSGYEQLNPHVMEAGDPARPLCTFCHAGMPVKNESGWSEVDFHMSGSLNDMCTGCHRIRPHPGSMFSSGPAGGNHLTKPSAAIAENMKETEEDMGLVFPLNPSTGEVYCATCHDPHPEDLEGYPVSNSPGSKYMLRVDNNCQACHDL